MRLRLRERMRRCNRYCAISHSVRALPATLREPASPAVPFG